MRARILMLVGLVAAALLALGLTGVVDLSVLGIGSRTSPADVVSPDEADAAAREDPRLAGAPGARVKKPGGMDSTEEVAEPPKIPSEVSGTSPTGGTLRGRVVRSEAKVPVEGAVVRLTRPDSLFHYLRAKREGRYDDLTARTDPNGRFAFKDVVPADGYALLAREGGGAAVTKIAISLAARQQRDVGDLVVGPAGGLGGRVVDGAGRPIAAVRVAVTWQVKNEFQVVIADPDSLPWVEGETKTDAEGRWSIKVLEPGDKTVVWKAPSGASDVLTPITVTAGEQRNDVDAVLGGTLAVAGRVVWKGGAPIDGARVFAKSDQKSAAWSMETGADGAYRIGGLTEGKYMIGALVPGIPIKLSDSHPAGEENFVIEFEPVGSLVGTVVAKASRKPIPRFRVDARFAGDMNEIAQYVTQQFTKILGATPFERPDGGFRFERLREGPYVLTVEAEGYPKTTLEKPVEVVAGSETTGVVVELVDGNAATGAVVDASGPVAGAKILVVPDSDLKGADSESLAEKIESGEFDVDDAVARTDDQGRFDTGPLTPRAYSLVAIVEGRMPAIARGIDLRRGSRADVTLTIPRSGSIRVSVLDHRGRPAKGVGVDVVTADSKTMFADRTGDDGTCVVEPLTEAKWVVIREGSAVQSILHGRSNPVGNGWIEPVKDTRERYARLRALGGEEVDVADGHPQSVVIRLPRLAVLKGVVSVRGKPYAEQWAWVIDAGGLFVGSTRSDKEGRFTIEHVEPGSVNVYVNVAEKDAQQSWQATPVAVPDAEEATVEINR